MESFKVSLETVGKEFNLLSHSQEKNMNSLQKNNYSHH